jgi:hypothetical protein
VKDAIAIVLALVVGVFLASYDLRTDDTGIEVGLLLIVSVTLAAVAPKRWWLIALCVGLPIPIVEIALAHSALPGGVIAPALTIVGALIGFAVARTSTTSAAG